MSLSKRQIFLLIFLIQVLINTMFIFGVNVLMTRTILSFVSLILFPGILIFELIKPGKVNFVEAVLYCVGLSISFLYIIGLLLNSILPKFGLNDPLSYSTLNISINSALLMLGTIVYIRTNNDKIYFNLPKLSFINCLFLVPPPTFVLLSVFGASILNNQGSNIYAYSLLIFIGVYVFLISIFNSHIKHSIYPYIIFFTSLSLLLSYSLRSWHIIGWDINEEYQMFQLTKAGSFWNILESASPFNSCLSVTILPTILSSFLRINDEYLFKIIYQIIFALVPVSIYCIVQKYVNSFLAFFAAFFFVVQGLFYLGMTAIIRQEIAFLFFTLLFQSLFKNELSVRTKNVLFSTFGFSLVVSHYSTSYIALIYLLFLYLAVYVVFPLVKRFTFLKIKIPKKTSIIPIVSLLAFTIFWNVFVTKSTNNVLFTFRAMVRNFDKIYSMSGKNATIFTFLFNKDYSYTNDQLNSFAYKFSQSYIQLYNLVPILTENNYDMHFMTTKYVSLVKSGTNKIFLTIYTIDKYFILISLFVGLMYTLTKKHSMYKTFDLEYQILAILTVIIIVTSAILPEISVAYNVDRLFLQGLVFSSIFIVLGCTILFNIFKNYSKMLMTLVVVIYFFFQSGLTAPLTGNVLRANVSNIGMEIDAHYTHESDIAAMKWLSLRYLNYQYVYMDSVALPKFKAYFGKSINQIHYVFPSLIDKQNYVYASSANSSSGVAFMEDALYHSGSVLYLSFPFDFLDQNKNLIFSGGGSLIYQ